MAIELGTNLQVVTDWDGAKQCADLVWHGRPWALVDGNGYNIGNWAPVDAYGWPQVSNGALFGTVMEFAPWPGVYKLTFKTRSGTSGQGTVSAFTGGYSLTFTGYNAGTNVTSYDLTVSTYNANTVIWLNWQAGTGITDVHLMRPRKDGTPHPVGTVLADYIVDRLQHFTTIRTMQTGTGNCNQTTTYQQAWSDRTKPYGPQSRGGRATASPSPFTGVAIENLVAMANQTGKHLWVCIPFYADDTYILNMARTIRYGSDGVNPYTSVQASPVLAPLRSDLNLYVEHANEIWNGGGGYWQAENIAEDQAERAAGDTNHTAYKSAPDSYAYANRRVGYLAVRNSLLFRQVFGDTAMMTRVRPVLATQHGSYGSSTFPLEYVNEVYGRGYSSLVSYGQTNQYGHVAQPVNYYLYALATAPYIPAEPWAITTTNVTTILDSTYAEMTSPVAGYPVTATTDNKALATSYGIQYVAYEGGNNLIPGVMPGVPATNLTNAVAAKANARMGAVITNGIPSATQTNYIYGRFLQAWNASGATLYCHFILSQGNDESGTFGLCPPSSQGSSDPRLETGPQWNAIKSFANPGYLATLATKTVWFAHQSIGQNILAGVASMLSSNTGAEPTVLADYAQPSGKGAGQIAQELNGNNGDPLGKIAAFEAKIDTSASPPAWAYGNLCDIVCLKFCWVDWAGPATPASVFAAYQAAVGRIKARWPDLLIVHCTTPLYQNNWAPDQGSNVTRQQFNVLMRNAYKATEPFFDIAELESTDPNGVAVVDADGAPSLYSGYADPDGGHLNATGQILVAPEWIRVLAQARPAAQAEPPEGVTVGPVTYPTDTTAECVVTNLPLGTTTLYIASSTGESLVLPVDVGLFVQVPFQAEVTQAFLPAISIRNTLAITVTVPLAAGSYAAFVPVIRKSIRVLVPLASGTYAAFVPTLRILQPVYVPLATAVAVAFVPAIRVLNVGVVWVTVPLAVLVSAVFAPEVRCLSPPISVTGELRIRLFDGSYTHIHTL